MPTDSNGLLWKAASGEQGVIEQTRNQSNDKRWSGEVEGISQYGYEVTSIFTFSGVTPDDAHFALKFWGGHHSGDCGYEEDGECCCWYDFGIREGGETYTQIERPHPNNDDVDIPRLITNIGISMEGNTIGLKWLVYPIVPGGTADNGGIRVLMWVDINPLTAGVPNNNWQLVLDYTDHGEILGDYETPDLNDVENRVSDTDSVTSFNGGLQWRKLQAGDAEAFDAGGGGTNPPPPPPPTNTSPLYRFISWGDNDTTSNAEDVLDQIFTETDVAAYLFAGDGPYDTDGTAWVTMMEGYFNTPDLMSKLYLAQGNHDHPESESQTTENDIEAWKSGLNNAIEGLEWLQSAKVGNAYIIVMNSQDDNIAEVGGDQYNYVVTKLTEAKALRASGEIDWIITMVHKSWFNLLGSNPAYVEARNAYIEVFRDAQVDFMFHGHNHSYMIWKPIVGRPGNTENTDSETVFTLAPDGRYDFSKDHGVIYTVNGNGGHEINSWGEDAADFPNVEFANDTDFGYSVLDIQGKQAKLIAKDVNGNILHTVEVTRGQDPTDDDDDDDDDGGGTNPDPPTPETVYADFILIYNINSDSDGCSCSPPPFTPPPPDPEEPPPPEDDDDTINPNAIYDISYIGSGSDQVKIGEDEGDDSQYLQIGIVLAGSDADLIGEAPLLVEVALTKEQDPQGTVSVVIRSANNNLQTTMGTIQASSISSDNTQYYPFQNLSSAYVMQEGDMILVEFSGGDNDNYVIGYTKPGQTNGIKVIKRDNTMSSGDYRDRDQEFAMRVFV